jgi:multisubunit Na+/H+ antiporter MnhF subunit
MTGFLTVAALVLLGLVAVGGMRLLVGPGRITRMMAAQMAGTGCAGVVLLLSATWADWIIDVAIVLALLATMAIAALWRFDSPAQESCKGELE